MARPPESRPQDNLRERRRRQAAATRYTTVMRLIVDAECEIARLRAEAQAIRETYRLTGDELWEVGGA